MTSPFSVLLSDLTLKLFPAFLPSWPQAARIRIQPSQPAVVTYLKVPVANVVTVVTGVTILTFVTIVTVLAIVTIVTVFHRHLFCCPILN